MGKFILILLVLAAAIGGAGYWNYHRNAYLDEDLEKRPYEGLDEAELNLLLEAHRAERDKYQRQLDLVSQRQDPMGRYADEDLSGKLKAFDRVQKNSSQWKAVNRQVLDQEIEIERIQHELSVRASGLDDEWTRIWRRVTTF